MKRKGLLSLIISLLALHAASAEKLVTLKGHVAPQIKTATKLERVPADERIDLSLTVRLDQKALDQAIEKMYGKSSPKQRHYLTSTEFAEQFGLADKRQKLKDFAAANGLTIDTSAENPNSQSVKVYGASRQVENAFHVKLHHYRDAKGRKFHASDTDPSIPASIAPQLNTVLGLSNNVDVARPHFKASPVSLNTPSVTKSGSGVATPAMTISGGTGPGGTLAPADIQTIYGLQGVPFNGTGQTVALFELDGFNPADIAGYETQFGLPQPPVAFVGVDGTTNLCGGQSCATQTVNGNAWMVEVALDIEMVVSLAPRVSNILVYDDANTLQGILDTYNQIAVDNTAQIVSTSWAVPEAVGVAYLNTEYQTFQRMALQGQTIYAASGDSGAYGNASTTNADDPASQPFVTAAGGTSLAGSLLSYTETAWIDSGGGVSGTWPLPSYQTGIAGLASQQFRNIPDVALNADRNSGYAVAVAGSWYQVGGTSAAAPLWAGFTALVNQKLQASSMPVFGFANPSLYQNVTNGIYHTVFNDITQGSNGFYNASQGYDNVTGLGSFKGSSILSSIVNPPTIPTISPNGGIFTNSVQVTLADTTLGAQIYYTTNGSVPTSSSTLYTGSFTLNSSYIVRAIAQAPNHVYSPEATPAIFVIGTIPVIASPLYAAGGAGQPFNYQIYTAGSPTNDFFAFGLPPGLSLAGNGEISGTLISTGSFTFNSSVAYNVSLTVLSGQGTATATLTLTVYPPCDVNHDGIINAVDIQNQTNMALEVLPCTNSINHQTPLCNVGDIQRVITAASGGACAVGP